MPCKKTELASAINSFGSARVTGDSNLIAFSIELVKQLLDTLEFTPEDDAVVVEDTEVKEAELV